MLFCVNCAHCFVDELNQTKKKPTLSVNSLHSLILFSFEYLKMTSWTGRITSSKCLSFRQGIYSRDRNMIVSFFSVAFMLPDKLGRFHHPLTSH